MLDPTNRDRIMRHEHLAPKRLKRGDVETLRRMFQDVHQLDESRPGISRRIYLTRSDSARALIRLGAKADGAPHCLVRAHWSTWKVSCIQVDVFAHPDATSNFWTKIASHRFRAATTQARFVRDVSRYVRLGFGLLLSETGLADALLLH